VAGIFKLSCNRCHGDASVVSKGNAWLGRTQFPNRPFASRTWPTALPWCPCALAPLRSCALALLRSCALALLRSPYATRVRVVLARHAGRYVPPRVRATRVRVVLARHAGRNVPFLAVELWLCWGRPESCTLLCRVGHRHGVEQVAWIGVVRAAVHLRGAAQFDDLSAEHHGHMVYNIAHDGQVVGNEQVGRPSRGRSDWLIVRICAVRRKAVSVLQQNVATACTAYDAAPYDSYS